MRLAERKGLSWRGREGVAFTLKLFTTGDGLPGFGLIIDSVRALEVSGQLFIEIGREG